MKYKNNYKYDERVFNLKNSSYSLKSVTRLTTKQPTGSVDKKQKQALDLRVYKGTLIAENVYDVTIDRVVCSLCGKSNCPVNRLDIPESTLERFYQENFSCEKIADCIKANKTDYLKSDKVKLGILTLGYELSIDQLTELFLSGENIGLKGIELLIRDSKATIKQIEILLSGKVIETSMQKIQPFVKPTKKGSNLDNSEIESILTSKNDRRLIKSKKIEIVKDNSFSYNKANYQQIITGKKLFIAKLEKARKDLLTYKIPNILTFEQQNELEQNAEKLSGKKRKFALHKVRFTESFLANYTKDIPINCPENLGILSTYQEVKRDYSFNDLSGKKHNCKTLKGALRVIKKLK